jgi:hypothetical protein
MIDLTTLKPRILQVLEDPTGKRFDDAALAEAIRQAMNLINERLPNIAICTFTVTVSGRDQTITGMDNCMYLVSIQVNPDDAYRHEVEPGNSYTYRFQDGNPVLRFLERNTPQAGDVIRIAYAAPHTLWGLDGATTTTLPSACASALVNGAAGQACLLRASLLCEAYGSRPVETTRLLELSRILMASFENNLSQYKTLQEFGFPPGFRLDADDRQTGAFR